MKFTAIDTETFNGSARIIADVSEYRRVNNFDDILSFLTLPKFESKILFSYNMQYDATAIIKPLLLENRKYWREIATDILSKKGFQYGDYNISFFGKSLQITGKHHATRVYDLAQFYEYQHLDSAAKQYLGMQKDDSAQWVQHVIDYQNGKYTLEQIEQYLDNYYWQIGMYCQKDSILTYKLAQFMRDAYENSGITFKNPLSQAKLAEYHITKQVKYPTSVHDKVKKFERFAKLSYHGGLFETYRMGFLDYPIYNYDINSAYPNVMYDLPHWYNGYFDVVEQPTKYTKYGWYLTLFDCEYIPFPDFYTQEVEYFFNNIPMKLDVASYRILYPKGYRIQVVTKPELELMEKYNYKYKVLKGLEWYQLEEKYKNPFEWIYDAYYKRLEIKKNDKTDARQYALKKTYNSSYGKTAQHKKSIGKLTNFFYASYITALTRCKVAEIKIKNPNNIIEIATDGVYSDKPIKLDIGEELGQWEEHVYDKAIYLGSGMKQLFYDKPDKDGNTFETYLRGITNNRNYDLCKILKENPEKKEIPFTKNRPIKIKECLAHVYKLDLDDLNQFTDVQRKLKINSDIKHHWSYEYKNFGEIFDLVSYGSQYDVSECKPFGKVFVPNKYGTI